MRMGLGVLGAAVVFALWIANPARGQADDIALQRQLDQRVSLTMTNQPLSDAFKQIAATGKIPLQVDPACYALLPYGETTRVSVDFKSSVLRDALDEVLIPLGLQKTVVGTNVLIQPSAPLSRIGRRAEWEELKLIKELWSSDGLKMPANGVFQLTDAIRAAVPGRKELLVSLGADAALTPAQERAVEQIGRQLPMSAYRAMELYCQLTSQVWFVEAGPLAGGSTGGTVRAMTQRQWINRQLDRPIQLVGKDKPLEMVVADLTHVSGIRFVPEPGLYQVVPVVNVGSDNATVRRTLELMAGVTRIAFEIREDSILLSLSPGPGNQQPRSDAVIGRISAPVGAEGLMMDVFIRESDLPAEVNDLLKRQRQAAVDAWVRSMVAPRVPATAPATMPATAPAATGAATRGDVP